MDIISCLTPFLGLSSSIHIIIFLSTLIFFLINVLTKFSGGDKPRQPPSPPGLPLIGNFHQLGALPHQSLRRLSEKHGPLMLLHLGQSPTLIVSSSEVAREMIKSHDTKVINRPNFTAADILLYNRSDMGFAPYDDYWRQTRKLSSLELLSHRRVESFQGVREEEIALLLDEIRQASLKGSPVNLSQMLLSVSTTIISRCLFGLKPDEVMKEQQKSPGELLKEFSRLFGTFCVGDFVPYLKWIDNCTGLIGQMRKTARELDALLEYILEQNETNPHHPRIIDNDDDSSEKKNLARVLLQLQKDDKSDFGLNRDRIKALLLDLFLGGSDTSPTTVEWAMSELIRNPEKMKKAQAEVRRIVGTKPEIDKNDLAEMKYLNCVIKEAMRLHPAGPLGLPRETTSAVTLAGYEIPVKTRVMINSYAIQRDPKVWEKAEEFIPERFEEIEASFNGHDFRFIPFGTGRRSCPGMTFAVVTVEYMLANLLHWFDWKLPGGAAGEDLDMAENYGIAVDRKNHLFLVPTTYST